MPVFRRTIALVLLVVGPALLAAPARAAEPRSQPSAKPIRLAVYRDSGVSGKVSGLIELLSSYKELTVATLSGEEIRAGKLQNFDVVVFPGGSGSK